MEIALQVLLGYSCIRTMCECVPIYNPQNGVHFGGRIAGPRIRTPDPGFEPISVDLDQISTPTDGVPHLDPEMTPNWTQFGCISGCHHLLVLLKGQSCISGYIQDWPRVGTDEVSWDPKWSILGPKDDTPDTAYRITHQTARQILRSR